MSPLLEVSDLHVRFEQRGGRDVHAVAGLSYALEGGTTLAIIGESGSGKTVSSRAIMGLLPEYARVTGSARLDGTELIGLSDEEMRRHRGADVAMIFQDPARSLNPTMRIGAQITEAIHAHADVDKADARERAMELLALVRLPAAEQRFSEYPHQLSGGMRQRVMIAIALAARPKLLIADEATTALDVTIQDQILSLLLDLQRESGMAILLVSHDLGVIAQACDRVTVMYAGYVVEQATTPALFARPRHPYTLALLKALPELAAERADGRLVPIRGQPPDLAGLPPGCPFAPRCEFVHAEDPSRRAVSMELQEVEPDHFTACPFHAEVGL
jgi:oligopeptide/dipeptide ABC transporter ATP-binding protein